MIQNDEQKFINIINNIDINNKPKLLLHACCAPCSSHCLSILVNYFQITIFFYNPNISPFSEYEKRLMEEIRFINEAYNGNINVINASYDNDLFEEMAKGLENLKEGGERCFKCYRLRLDKTAEYASRNKFDYFATTLTLSPYKNSKKLNEIGEELSKKWSVKYLFSDFKKNNGYKHSIELSHKYNLYRQNYCGCRFSKKAREQYESSKIEHENQIKTNGD